MTKSIVFTNDWELYGDGTGDYETLQGRPLRAILDLFDRYKVPFSIMAEIGQQIIKPIPAWKTDLTSAVKRGHDVQLHLHPQWFYNLDPSTWAVSKMNRRKRLDILETGKLYLENLLKPIDPTYRCVVFRAGAYCIQPSKEVFEDLQSVGFLADTTITPGAFSNGYFDFRKPEPCPLKELPIAAKHIRAAGILRRLLSTRDYYKLAFGVNLPQEEIDWLSYKPKGSSAYGKPHLPLKGNRYLRALGKQAIQLDYDLLPATAIVAAIKQHKSNLIILSGHTKNMPNINNLEWLLYRLSRTDYKYLRIRDSISTI